jgi:hypothetical protein
VYTGYSQKIAPSSNGIPFNKHNIEALKIADWYSEKFSQLVVSILRYGGIGLPYKIVRLNDVIFDAMLANDVDATLKIIKTHICDMSRRLQVIKNMPNGNKDEFITNYIHTTVITIGRLFQIVDMKSHYDNIDCLFEKFSQVSNTTDAVKIMNRAADIVDYMLSNILNSTCTYKIV